MSIFKGDHGSVKPSDEGNSAKVFTPAGSGSRPVKSKSTIETSAPEAPHTLDRAPKGWLK